MSTPSPLRASLSAALGPRTGQVVGGRYRLVAPVAEGGMGSVWRAEHTSLGHAVAVKFLAGGSAANPEHRTRFEREARIAAKIAEDSRHVVKVTDHGVEDDGTPWLVMELLHGEGLDKRLRREPQLPLSVAVEIVKQIARGLEAAHRHGVVHRDLKPANIYLCSEDSFEDRARGVEEIDARLLDFGVAKSLWEEDAPTTEGVVLGTIGYMSPEQLSGDRDIDARTDVWSLGAIAYRILVGKPAFGVGTNQEVAARVSSSEPMPPSQAAAGLPAELDPVLARGLAKDPKQRYGTARELADALAHAALVSAPENGLQSTTDGAVMAAPPVKRSRRRAAWGAVFAIALLVTGFTVLRLVRAPVTESASPGSAVVPPPVQVTSPSPNPEPSAKPSAVAPSVSASASASVPPPAPVPLGKVKPAPKVIDTWKKKDEL